MIYDESNFTECNRPTFTIDSRNIYAVDVPQSRGFRILLMGPRIGEVMDIGVFKTRRAAELYLAWVKLQ